MPDAQIIGAIAVRVEADLSSYTEDMRALRTGMAALEKTPITIKVKLDSGNEFSRMKAQLADLQRPGIGGGSSRMAEAVRAGSLPPSYTVDGRGFLVNSSGFAGGGGGGGGGVGGVGGRFAVGGMGVQTPSPQVAAQQVMQTINVMRQAVAAAPPITVPIVATAGSGGAGGLNAMGGGAGGFGLTVPQAGGGRGVGVTPFVNRRFFRDMFLGSAMVGGGLSIGNALLTSNEEMAMANSAADQTRAQLKLNQSIAGSIPMLGTAAGAGANLLGAIPMWKSVFGSSTIDPQGTERNLMEGEASDRFRAMQSSGLGTRMITSAKIDALATGFDNIARSEMEIANQLKLSHFANAQKADADKLAIGDNTGDENEDALRHQRRLVVDDMRAQQDRLDNRMALAQLTNLRDGIDNTKMGGLVSQIGANNRLALGSAINNPLAQQHLAINEAKSRLVYELLTTPVAVREQAQKTGDAQIKAMVASYKQNLADVEYDSATRQQIAAVHTGAGGLTSNEYIAGASRLISRGRAMAEELRKTPRLSGDEKKLFSSVYAADVADLRAERADLTRVGSKTFAESVDPGYTNIAGLQSAGGQSAEELRGMKEILEEQLTTLKAIATKNGGVVGP